MRRIYEAPAPELPRPEQVRMLSECNTKATVLDTANRITALYAARMVACEVIGTHDTQRLAVLGSATTIAAGFSPQVELTRAEIAEPCSG